MVRRVSSSYWKFRYSIESGDLEDARRWARIRASSTVVNTCDAMQEPKVPPHPPDEKSVANRQFRNDGGNLAVKYSSGGLQIAFVFRSEDNADVHC